MTVDKKSISWLSEDDRKSHRFVWTCDGKIQVFGLGLSKGGKLDIELCQMSSCNFLVKLLGQHMHTKRELLRSGPKRDLGEDLIAEGA